MSPTLIKHSTDRHANTATAVSSYAICHMMYTSNTPDGNKPTKGIVHLKILIVSSFTHLQVVLDLYECLSSAEHKRLYFEECG